MSFFTEATGWWKNRLCPHSGKILGPLIGLIAGLRVFGLIFGFLAGCLLDRIFQDRSVVDESPLGRIRAAAAAVLRAAETAKKERPGAEGSSLDDPEVEIIRQRLHRNFALSASGAAACDAVISTYAAGEDLPEISGTLRFDDPPEQFALLQSFYQAASLFGPVGAGTRTEIQRLSSRLGVPPELEQPAYYIFAEKDEESYRLLGVDADTPTQEIKRVFRSLAAEFHPDGLYALEDEQKKAAEEAFVKIRKAYEAVMREREH
jgi:hypothetical protein